MSTVGLNGSRLKSLVETKFPRGVASMLAYWQSHLVPKASEISKVPDRSTVYRWYSGKLPRNPTDLLALCAILDVDPVAVLEPKGADPPQAIEYLLSSFQLNHWRNPSLRFLTEFFGRHRIWPPPLIAKQHYGRPWQFSEVQHPAAEKANYYARIQVQGSRQVFETRPQVFHVAFRHDVLFGRRWLQYGILERYGSNIRLYHINGHVDAYETKIDDGSIMVETWFGPGPAVFRFASLHPVQAYQIEPTGERYVRFPG